MPGSYLVLATRKMKCSQTQLFSEVRKKKNQAFSFFSHALLIQFHKWFHRQTENIPANISSETSGLTWRHVKSGRAHCASLTFSFMSLRVVSILCVKRKKLCPKRPCDRVLIPWTLQVSLKSGQNNPNKTEELVKGSNWFECLLSPQLRREGMDKELTERWYKHELYVGCSESNASCVTMLVHDIRNRCWWDGSRVWTFSSLSFYMLLLCDRWQQRGSLTKWCLTWMYVWSKGVELNSSMQIKWYPLTFNDACECLWRPNSGCDHSEVVVTETWKTSHVLDSNVDFYHCGTQASFHHWWKMHS